MAHLVIVIDTTDSIADLNSKIQRATKPHETLNLLLNYFNAIGGGVVDASLQVTVRDTAPTVTTSGSGSTQLTYNLK
jgi:hypothetical protein